MTRLLPRTRHRGACRDTRAGKASAALLGVVLAVVAGCGSDDWEVNTDPDGEVRDYSVEFFVETASRFGALQLEITHHGDSGGFIGRGDKVDCVPLVEAIMAANYFGERVAKVGLISLEGIRTPAAILRCGFRTDEDLAADDFLVEVTDASDPESRPLDPVPSVVVSSVTAR